jgi:predicted hydrocarbon binding protein
MTRCQFIEQRLLQEIKVMENGRPITMTYFEIILIQLMKKVAETGSQRALRILKKYQRFASDKKMRNRGYVRLEVDGENYARLLREGI